jgi:hypothetical protein
MFLRTLPLLIALLVPSVAHAGAWTKGWGEYYTKIGADYYKAARYVDPSTGEEVEGLNFFGHQYSVYGEFGVLPVWPLQVSFFVPVSIGISTFEDDMNFDEGETGRASSTHFGDAKVSLQAAILKKGFQLSPSFDLKIPLYSNDKIGSDFGVWREAFPVPGDGQLDFTGWINLGAGIPKTPMFMQGGVGYRHRSSVFVGWDTDLDFVDGIPFTYTLGANLGPLLGMFQVDGIKNLKEDEITRENLALGVAMFLTVYKGLAVEARFAGEVWANNAAQGISAGVGLSWRMPYPGYVPRKDRKSAAGG